MIGFGKLKIKNFGCIGKAELNLNEGGLCLIVGENLDTGSAISNGSGKSTALRSICWALYGKVVESGRLKVVTEGKKEARVSIEIIDNNITYTVIRSYTNKNNRTELTIEQSGKKLNKGLRTGQDFINELIGLDWLSFRNTVIYGQGDISHFADPRTADTQRKIILSTVLGLERFEKARSFARLKLKEEKDTRIQLEAEFYRLEGIVAGLQIDWLELESSEFKRKKKESLLRLGDKLEKLKSQFNEINRSKNKLPSMNRRLDDVSSILNDFEKSKKEIAEYNTKRANSRSNLSLTHERIKDVSYQLDAIDNELKRFEDGKCPTCGTPAENLHVARTLVKIKDRKKDAEQKIALYSKEKMAEFTKLEHIKSKIEDLELELKEIPEWKKNYDMLKCSINQIENTIDSKAEIQNEIKILLQEIVEEKAKANRFVKRLEVARAKEKECKSQMKGCKKKLKNTSDESKKWEFWVRGFGPQGLPSYLLDSVVPLISERANYYLEILTDGDITITLDTTSELKGGGYKDQLIIHTLVEGMTDVIPSGGQMKKITIACDLALMDVVAQREGASLNLLLMDEILDGLDAIGRTRIITLLEHLRETKKSLYVITHDPDLLEFSEKFDKVITVVKQNGIAKIIS